jgi:hypothetical protein
VYKHLEVLQLLYKRSKIRLSYHHLTFKVIQRILSFWHHPVEVYSCHDWIKLFGKKNGQYRQIYTRISFDSFMRNYNSGVKADSNLYPFDLEYPVSITSVTARTHFTEQIWLSKWKALREIKLIGTSKTHRECISYQNSHKTNNRRAKNVANADIILNLCVRIIWFRRTRIQAFTVNIVEY